METMAGERPFPNANTIAIHSLAEHHQLKKPLGKKMMANELGFARPGGAGGTCTNRRNRKPFGLHFAKLLNGMPL